MKKILLLNHSQVQCGVYQFGKRIYDIVSNSENINCIYKELETKGEYYNTVSETRPDYILYNWYPITMAWLTNEMISNQPHIKHYFIFHDGNVRQVFDKYLFFGSEGKDLSFPKEKTIILPRPLFKYEGNYPVNDIITIGSFGFGGWQKGFTNLVEYVNNNFEEAIINIQMPFAYFGDRHGVETKKIAEACYKLNINPKIVLNIDHSFLSTEDTLKFLASNDINVFLYHAQNQGLSSVIDYALSVNRPIAITNNSMFKHIFKPEICIDNFSIKEILDSGTKPLEDYYKNWSNEIFAQTFREVFDGTQ